jgi:sialidase-1
MEAGAMRAVLRLVATSPMNARLWLYASGVVLWFATLPAPSSAEPMFTDMDLFVSGHDNVNIYRIPSLIVAPSGMILAFIEAREGDDGDPTDLALKRSRYTAAQPVRMLNGYPRVFGYGVNWEPMRTVLPGKGQAIMNPCPVIDRSTGRIWLPCYEVRGGLKEHLKDGYAGRLLLTWSDDEGLTWASPRDLTSSAPRFAPGPGVGIQLRAGRLVVPGYWAPGPGMSVPPRSCVIYSDDHARTWLRGEPVKGNTDESQIVELSDGVLMLNCRSNRGKACRYVALSRDGGRTWFEEFDDARLPEPGDVCQGSLFREPQPGGGQKPRLVFVNPTGGRENLAVKLSSDDGKTWSAGRIIRPGPAAYSGVAFLKDGTIGVLYETGKAHAYERIAFARFNLEWLIQR